MLRKRLAMVLVATALAVTACGGGTSDDVDAGMAAGSPTSGAATSPADAASAPAASGTAPAGSAAPPAGSPVQVPDKLQFMATTLDGTEFKGAELAGKPVVFWFWAPWCPKCKSEAPGVAAVSAQYQGRVAFVGVAGLDQEAAMKKFVADTKTGGIPHLSDEKGEIWRKLGITQQSTFVFMAPDGSTTKASGPLGKDQLAGKVAELAAKG
jgi:thiol-disulfide isomerase/thioredoxin